jgi:peptidoglycan/LPS O-acetylase OafA/YrhL
MTTSNTISPDETRETSAPAEASSANPVLLESIPSAEGRGQYFPALDGLRALAVCTVLIGHLIPVKLLVAAVSWGDTGVVLFFCLSGFLITSILLDIDTTDTTTRLHGLRIFYLRRALRIFPIYYLVIAIALLVTYAPVVTNKGHLLTYTLNLPGFPMSQGLGAASHFWSLSVEEQYYLIWPLVTLFLRRKHLAWCAIGTIALSFTYKLSLAFLGGDYGPIFRPITGCLDSLGLGSLLAIMRHRTGGLPVCSNYRLGMLITIFGSSFAVLTCFRITMSMDPWFRGHLFFGVVYFFVCALLSTCLIAQVTAFPSTWIARNFLAFGFLRSIGQISYGIYVYHMFTPAIYKWLTQAGVIGGHSEVFQEAACLVMTFGAAISSWWLIEKPILKLKRFISYRESKPGEPKRASKK